MTLVRSIRTAAQWSRRVAAGALAVCALRFGYASVTAAFASPPQTVDDPVPRDTSPGTDLDRRPPWELPEAPEIPGPSPSASAQSVRMTLAVTVGEPRSQVFVNGRAVGHTPFVGEVSCKQGRTVRVEIVPVDDPLITFERRCRGGTVRLTEPDPPGIEPL